jgi:hypothetical protein
VKVLGGSEKADEILKNLDEKTFDGGGGRPYNS